jgi:hypothetical protein
LKPIVKDSWDYRIVRNPWYGYSLDLPTKQVGGRPALQHFVEKGAGAMLIWRWWDAFAYPAPIGYEKEFRAMVRACHQYGIKVVPYVGGFVLSERAPEAPFFKDEMAKKPLVNYPLRMPGLKDQMGYIVCQNSSWQDFLVDGIARLIDEYGVDGVYLDSTSIPWACSNALHGCGYQRPDGTRATTYPVFAVRENMRRIYSAVRQRKPDGIVDLHVYDCMNSGALAFATTYWNGEQLTRGHKFKPEALPLDRFRTEFMGYNWGVPADLLYYILGGYRECMALALIHDVPIRVEKLDDLDLQSSFWALREAFRVKEAQWWPYWNNAEVVTVSPAECYVSLYQHPANGVLAFVANLSRKAADVQLALDTRKLGLAKPLAAQDGLSRESIPVKENKMELSLRSQGWRIVWIRSGTIR